MGDSILAHESGAAEPEMAAALHVGQNVDQAPTTIGLSGPGQRGCTRL